MTIRRTARAAVLTFGLLAAPLAAEAQQAGKVWKIGFLGGSPSAVPQFIQAFQQGLRELGYVEGQNMAIERRYSEGRAERLPDLATTLVRLKADVIVVDACGAPLNAASQATSTIPIVVAACNDDLVATGLISSLARPGGNITGLSELTPELGAKRLELLKEVVPRVRRVAVLWNPAYSERFSANFRFWSSDCVAGGRPAARRSCAGPGRDDPGEDQPDQGARRWDASQLHPFRVHQREERVDRLLHRPPGGHPGPPGEEAGQVHQARKEGDRPGDPGLAGGQPNHRRRVGSTTYTRGRDRDETVDFSINFFFTGTQLLVKKGSGITDLVTFQNHAAGFLALEQGRIVAYVTDGILLAGLAAKARNPKDYAVVGDFLSKDPYSCMVPENDSKWRDFVNHTFMELIDSRRFFALYDKWFGERGVLPYPMTDQVRNYMIMQSMPE